VNLDDIIGMEEAAERTGRTPQAMRKAALRGTLEAKRIGPRHWVTTPEMVARYAARVALDRREHRPVP